MASAAPFRPPGYWGEEASEHVEEEYYEEHYGWGGEYYDGEECGYCEEEDWSGVPLCRNGAACPFLVWGTCQFYHPEQDEEYEEECPAASQEQISASSQPRQWNKLVVPTKPAAPSPRATPMKKAEAPKASPEKDHEKNTAPAHTADTITTNQQKVTVFEMSSSRGATKTESSAKKDRSRSPRAERRRPVTTPLRAGLRATA